LISVASSTFTISTGMFSHLIVLIEYPTAPRDGFWDKEEIEAVYGAHHIYNKKKSKARLACSTFISS
jgi:hypothetical protein